MPTLTELIEERASLADAEVAHLHRLVGSWQLIADLSFADLLLWCRSKAQDGFFCVAQMRPYTAQTLHPEDAFGRSVRPEEIPVIDRAYHERRSWSRDEPVLIDGVSVQMDAFPVLFGGRVIAVLSRESAPLSHRRPGRLEQNYMECGGALGKMVEEGNFPFEEDNLDAEISPRVGDGLIRLDPGGQVLYASPNAISAYRRLGLVSNLEGEDFADLGVDNTSVMDSLGRGIPTEVDVEVGNSVVLQRALPFLRGPSKLVDGALILMRDVTELRHRERQLERKEAVIREIHHRVKNNLQTIASLLRLQARRLGSEEAKAALEEAVRRIASIAVVHETLSRESGELVHFHEVAHQIAAMVRDSLIPPDRGIELVLRGDPGRLPADLATPLAIVLIELLQNAVEHAFGPQGGRIDVDMSREGERVLMVVADDGVGLPESFDIEGSSGLGLQIVKALVVSELEGTIAFEDMGGTRVSIDLPSRKRMALRP